MASVRRGAGELGSAARPVPPTTRSAATSQIAVRLRSRDAVEESSNKPQRREERSAAKPQPRPGETGKLKTGKCKGSHFPVFNLPVFMLACGPAKDFLAACEQFRVLQCRGRLFPANWTTSTENRLVSEASPCLFSLRSSRLCGLLVPALTGQIRLRGNPRARVFDSMEPVVVTPATLPLANGFSRERLPMQGEPARRAPGAQPLGCRSVGLRWGKYRVSAA